ncbi:NAD(P)/FAD-dependent oxidoreductase [Maricurvus nonylphenolicus]|uniref:NAD(P)-binding protein n=1 Tax=Maricurvus nonylphenolicus TaxID=1008307 RepID=UPI0036F26EF7
MTKSIKRRDFMNGMAFSLAGAALAPKTLMAESITQARGMESGQQELPADYYPPTRNGMRGSHEGSYEVAHDMAWRGVKPERYADINEEYDLIVVGAGISGLAAASLYQKHTGGNQRILILDNHDDFGGHAKRNEFHSQGKMLLGYGGSQNLEYPDEYDTITRDFLEELGVDFDQLEQAVHPEFPVAKMDQPMGLFLDEQSEKIVNGMWLPAQYGKGNYKELIAQLELPEDEKQRLMTFFSGGKDYLADMSLNEKLEYIASTSYKEFLVHRVGLTNRALSFSDSFVRMSNCVGADSLSLTEAFASGAPGLQSVGSLGKLAADLAVDPNNVYTASFFPDGNASIARMLVRRLIPGVASGNSMTDVVTAKFDYQKLDAPENLVRLRLNSTVVEARNQPDGSVTVSYVDKSGSAPKNLRVKAKHSILACYNGIIPHLCPELPKQQKEHLKYGVKAPFLYVNVLIRDGAVINKAGVNLFNCPNSPFQVVHVTPLTTMGEYEHKVVDGEPTALFMTASPPPQRDLDNPNQTVRDLFRQGRYKLYSTPFSDYETDIKEQLNKMFGQFGFDAEKDLEAITVNRWSHGYAYGYFDLFDPEWEQGQAPHELGRKPIGNITIANSDSEAEAYVNGAVKAAWRAVKEQLLR